MSRVVAFDVQIQIKRVQQALETMFHLIQNFEEKNTRFAIREKSVFQQMQKKVSGDRLCHFAEIGIKQVIQSSLFVILRIFCGFPLAKTPFMEMSKQIQQPLDKKCDWS